MTIQTSSLRTNGSRKKMNSCMDVRRTTEKWAPKKIAIPEEVEPRAEALHWSSRPEEIYDIHNTTENTRYWKYCSIARRPRWPSIVWCSSVIHWAWIKSQQSTTHCRQAGLVIQYPMKKHKYSHAAPERLPSLRIFWEGLRPLRTRREHKTIWAM